MKRVVIALTLLASAPSLAESPTPMRPVSQSIVTSASLNDVQACATRDIAHNGKPVVVPIDHGVEIDQLATTLLTKPVDPRFRVRITDQGDKRTLEAFYRHPFTEKAATQRLGKMRKTCGL